MAKNNSLLGKDFSIWLDSSIVAYGTDWDLQIDKKLVEITNLSSNGWSDKMADGKSWKFSLNGFAIRTVDDVSRGYDYLANSIINVDSSLMIFAKPNVTGNKYLSGAGFLNSLKISGKTEGAITYSASFEGTGPLTIATA